MDTIIKIAVVSVLSLFAIVGVVSISLAKTWTITENNGNEWKFTTEEDKTNEWVENFFNDVIKSHKYYDTNKYSIKRVGCKTEFTRMNEIYDSCIIDKMPNNPKYDIKRTVRRACRRISCNPSFIENLRY